MRKIRNLFLRTLLTIAVSLALTTPCIAMADATCDAPAPGYVQAM